MTKGLQGKTPLNASLSSAQIFCNIFIHEVGSVFPSLETERSTNRVLKGKWALLLMEPPVSFYGPCCEVRFPKIKHVCCTIPEYMEIEKVCYVR